jgi:predicted HicB family RNase H-like nuclease
VAEKTAAQKKAQKAYMEKFVRVEIRMDASKREAIQIHAESRSESVNAFINRAIDSQMKQDRAGIQIAMKGDFNDI